MKLVSSIRVGLSSLGGGDAFLTTDVLALIGLDVAMPRSELSLGLQDLRCTSRARWTKVRLQFGHSSKACQRSRLTFHQRDSYPFSSNLPSCCSHQRLDRCTL